MSDNYIQAAKLYARIDGVKIFLRDCLMDMSLRGDALNAAVVYPQQIESNIPGFWTEIFVEFPDGVSIALPISPGCTKIDTYNTMNIHFT